VRLEISLTDETGLVANAINQVNTSTTVVRKAVARLEFTPSTPIFARIAVNPAKNAESKGHESQFIPAQCATRLETSNLSAANRVAFHHPVFCG
jgi:hypothetical protein